MHIFNTDSSVWPGQDAGFLGRASDPWLFRCEPAAANVRIPEFTLTADVPVARLGDRRDLLQQLDRGVATANSRIWQDGLDPLRSQAFDLLSSPKARAAFDLRREPPHVRDRYGRHHFGQSCLLARRLVEAGVALVQVNWFRGPDEPSDAPCWDSHTNEGRRLKTVLAPTADEAFSALLGDLGQRGMPDETLVVCMAEFGRRPRLNGRAGRDHWGHVFSAALARWNPGWSGLRFVRQAGRYPRDGRVSPQDLTATVLNCLGYAAHGDRDAQGRPLAASWGEA